MKSIVHSYVIVMLPGIKMAKEFGRIKIHHLTDQRLEASLIWPGWECFQGEDESLVMNYFVSS